MSIHHGLPAAFGAAFLFASTGLAESNCLPFSVLLQNLAEKFAEAPAFQADEERGGKIHITTNPSGGWSLVLVRPDGCAVLVAGGRNWRPSAGPSL